MTENYELYSFPEDNYNQIISIIKEIINLDPSIYEDYNSLKIPPKLERQRAFSSEIELRIINN